MDGLGGLPTATRATAPSGLWDLEKEKTQDIPEG